MPQSNEALQPQLLSLHPRACARRREAPSCHNYDSPLAAIKNFLLKLFQKDMVSTLLGISTNTNSGHMVPIDLLCVVLQNMEKM